MKTARDWVKSNSPDDEVVDVVCRDVVCRDDTGFFLQASSDFEHNEAECKDITWYPEPDRDLADGDQSRRVWAACLIWISASGLCGAHGGDAGCALIVQTAMGLIRAE